MATLNNQRVTPNMVALPTRSQTAQQKHFRSNVSTGVSLTRHVKIHPPFTVEFPLETSV